MAIGLGGCIQVDPPDPPPGPVPAGPVPACKPGEALSTDLGGLICKPLPLNVSLVPQCDATSQALSSTTDGLYCTQRNAGPEDPSILKRIADVERTLGEVPTRLARLAVVPPSNPWKSFVGLSANTYPGHIKNYSEGYLGSVQDNGLLAASKICEKDFGAGARICLVGDIHNSAINGKLTRTALMTEAAWVYVVTMQNPLANPVEAGLGDNCAAFTASGASGKWMGTAFQWRVADSIIPGRGDVAPHFYLVACPTARRIACCK